MHGFSYAVGSFHVNFNLLVLLKFEQIIGLLSLALHAVVQCGREAVVRTLALRWGVPGFKTHSDHSLNLFRVVGGSTWFASCQLGFLTVVIVVLCRFVDCVSLALPPM